MASSATHPCGDTPQHPAQNLLRFAPSKVANPAERRRPWRARRGTLIFRAALVQTFAALALHFVSGREHVRFGADEAPREEDSDREQYYDRSFDHVARVRAAKEAAQRRMEEFGDISEYDVTILHGQLEEEPEQEPQPSLDFERKGDE